MKEEKLKRLRNKYNAGFEMSSESDMDANELLDEIERLQKVIRERGLRLKFLGSVYKQRDVQENGEMLLEAIGVKL